MGLTDLRTAGNVYNKGDAENWMTTPHFSEILSTSYLDVDNVVLFNEELVRDDDAKNKRIDFVDLFKKFNN